MNGNNEAKELEELFLSLQSVFPEELTDMILWHLSANEIFTMLRVFLLYSYFLHDASRTTFKIKFKELRSRAIAHLDAAPRTRRRLNTIYFPRTLAGVQHFQHIIPRNLTQTDMATKSSIGLMFNEALHLYQNITHRPSDVFLNYLIENLKGFREQQYSPVIASIACSACLRLLLNQDERYLWFNRVFLAQSAEQNEPEPVTITESNIAALYQQLFVTITQVKEDHPHLYLNLIGCPYYRFDAQATSNFTYCDLRDAVFADSRYGQFLDTDFGSLHHHLNNGTTEYAPHLKLLSIFKAPVNLEGNGGNFNIIGSSVAEQQQSNRKIQRRLFAETVGVTTTFGITNAGLFIILYLYLAPIAHRHGFKSVGLVGMAYFFISFILVGCLYARYSLRFSRRHGGVTPLLALAGRLHICSTTQPERYMPVELEEVVVNTTAPS